MGLRIMKYHQEYVSHMKAGRICPSVQLSSVAQSCPTLCDLPLQ